MVFVILNNLSIVYTFIKFKFGKAGLNVQRFRFSIIVFPVELVYSIHFILLLPDN